MRISIILLLLLTSLIAKDSDFSVIMNEPYDDALFDITQDYDRQISAVGFSKVYKDYSTNQNRSYTDAFSYLASVSDTHGSQMHLLKINNYANITLNKAIKMSTFSEAVAIVKTPSNGYFIGGYTLDGSLIVLKLDSNGNTIFHKSFGTKNYDRMNKLVKLSDGGILAVGSSITTRSKSDAIFESGLGLNDIYLTRFSKSGQKLWSKKYGTEHDDRGIDAVEAFDGSIMLLGITNYGVNKNLTLMRLNENGNKIWIKDQKFKQEVAPSKIIRLRDNNFLISLTQKDEMGKDQIRLIKFDIQKNTIIDKIIDTTYSSGLKDIEEYSDGSIIGVGYVKDASNTDGLVMMLDSNLEMLHQEHYGEKNYDMFNTVTILHNSQAAAAGVYTLEDSQESNMWVIKFNRDATIAQKSLKSANIYEEIIKLFKDEIESNIISIKEDLNIEFIDKELNFKVAEYKLSDKQKIFLDKCSSKLIPFLHKYKEYISTLEINGHTSSEWGSANFTNTYLKNEKLSMNRSFSTLSHIFKTQDLSKQIWLSNILKGSGLSYSKKVLRNKNEDREKSRRVSFKIILK
ncbi:MAG: outer membrane protein OmpA-like peptidoglycan-associated protein [Sulfurimonas sp.]|jgi:outer membrane protein OmpA-like peptidoglycan-associated protein